MLWSEVMYQGWKWSTPCRRIKGEFFVELLKTIIKLKAFCSGKLMNAPISHIHREESYVPGVSNGFIFYAKESGLVVAAQSAL